MKANNNSDYIFNCDTCIIRKTLELMKINWIDCEINLLKKTNSNIYKISVGNGNQINSENSENQTFILKINSSCKRHNKEIGALKRVSNVYFENKKGFYAIGHLTKDSNEIHLFQENPFDNLKSNSWFFNGVLKVEPIDDNNFAGVIIMFPGNYCKLMK